MRAIALLPALLLLSPLPGRADEPDPPLEAAPEAPRAAAMDGVWLFAGGEEELAAADRAVEEATAGFPALVRGIAKDRVRKRTPRPERYEIRTDGGRVTIRLDDSPPRTTTLDGAVHSFESDGASFTLARSLTAEGLHSAAVGEGGTVTSDFSLDGERLVVRIAVGSPRLPAPVVYRLSYRRSP